MEKKIFIINLKIDGKFIKQDTFSSETTIKQLKNYMLHNLNLLSVNYLIEYKDRDYSKFETFKLKEIILVPGKEVEINLKSLEQYIKDKNQKVIISYQEGSDLFTIYKTKNLKFETVLPERSSNFPFKKFPYNSRSVNLYNDNVLVITGGCLFENICCSYDYDINYIVQLPDMNEPRQLHSMVSLKDSVFAIGGQGIKSVEYFDLKYETWEKLPDMNYDRRDPAVCVINENILYVLMGYSQVLSTICSNIERFNISNSKKWELLALNDHLDLKIRINCGIIPYNDGFLLLGGVSGGSLCMNDVVYYNTKDLCLHRSYYRLPFPTSFVEKSMIKCEKEYYLFSYVSMRMVKFDIEKDCIVEISDYK